MGFADEVKQGSRAPDVPPAAAPAAPAAEAPAAAEPAKAMETTLFEHAMEALAKGAVDGLPAGAKPVDDKAKELPQGPEISPERMLEQKPKIRIGSREFTSVEEAMGYAQELELKRAQDEGFIEGIKAAQKDDKPAAPAKSLIEEVEEILFENPKAALEKLSQGIRQQIFSEYERMTVEQAQATQRAQQAQAAWSGFFKDNSDLAEAEQYVKYVFKRDEAELGPMKPDQGLKELAERARKELRIQRMAALPKQEMPSAPAVMAGASGAATTAAQASTTTEKLDFVSQVNKLRRRG